MKSLGKWSGSPQPQTSAHQRRYLSAGIPLLRHDRSLTAKVASFWPSNRGSLVLVCPAVMWERSDLLTLSIEHPLAQDFDILLGKINVTVPSNTAPGKDYQLVREYHYLPYIESRPLTYESSYGRFWKLWCHLFNCGLGWGLKHGRWSQNCAQMNAEH